MRCGVMRPAALLTALALGACTTALDESGPSTTGTLAPISSEPIEVNEGSEVTITTEAEQASECDRGYLQFLTAMGTVNGSVDQLRAIDDELRSVGEGLPDGMADDIATLAEAYGEYGDTLAEFDGDLAAAQNDPNAAKVIEAIGAGDVINAYDEVAGYFDDNCPVVTDSP